MRRFGWRFTAARSAARRCPSVPLTPSLAATSSLRRCLPQLEKLSADETAQTVLRLYDGDGVRYSGADTQAVEFAQYLLGNTEGVYQLTSE